ncbi:hypothetical protein Ahy_A07g034868 [Arachis hypogaea]|uniref:Uncharacterized protein n=1 Tax=Arachis hypogaea TaxID=3818 RepID=A0A445CD87_ARAHY|nr:hypothetical protein Ahy_A07g034868 [Arachis hypogaea]
MWLASSIAATYSSQSPKLRRFYTAAYLFISPLHVLGMVSRGYANVPWAKEDKVKVPLVMFGGSRKYAFASVKANSVENVESEILQFVEAIKNSTIIFQLPCFTITYLHQDKASNNTLSHEHLQTHLPWSSNLKRYIIFVQVEGYKSTYNGEFLLHFFLTHRNFNHWRREGMSSRVSR